jgi:hypothetical protein
LRGVVNASQYDYYWFTASVRNGAKVVPRWNQMIIVGNTDGSQRDVDLYASVFTGRLPNEKDFDYKSERSGPDHILINSDDALF